MSIKIDLGNQVRQTVLPQWKPLLPLFEAVMNSFQAIREAKLPVGTPGRVTIGIMRQSSLFAEDNPLSQAFKLIEEIRNGVFEVKGRPVPVSNDDIPASIYCICDLTPTFRRVLKVLDAFVTPDNQGFYGFHRGFNAYYEVID